jgi:hypothetical protein
MHGRVRNKQTVYLRTAQTCVHWQSNGIVEQLSIIQDHSTRAQYKLRNSTWRTERAQQNHEARAGKEATVKHTARGMKTGTGRSGDSNANTRTIDEENCKRC